MWRAATSAAITRDCSRTLDYADLRTEVRGFWTDTDLYFLFIAPYRSLNLFLPAANDAPRRGLWDRDVVEMFLGDDWNNIRHYREFEIAPTGDWIDLAIDLDRPNFASRVEIGLEDGSQNRRTRKGLVRRLSDSSQIDHGQDSRGRHAMAREPVSHRWRWP